MAAVQMALPEKGNTVVKLFGPALKDILAESAWSSTSSRAPRALHCDEVRRNRNWC